MKCKELASRLDGIEYPVNIKPEMVREAKEAGLVIVFGASDDLMEFRGAIDDELGCFEGGTAYLNSAGLLHECDDEYCPHFKKLKEGAKTIDAIWGESPDLSWSYKTEIPHETFVVTEDGASYCRGIVFELSDVSGLQ